MTSSHSLAKKLSASPNPQKVLLKLTTHNDKGPIANFDADLPLFIRSSCN